MKLILFNSFMELTLIDHITLLLLFSSFLFAAFIFTVKRKNRISNILIALFLLLNALEASYRFIDYFLFKSYPGLGLTIYNLLFLIPPLLYLYILSVIYSDFKIGKKDFLHLIPLIIATLVLIPRFYLVSSEGKFLFLKGGVLNGPIEIQISYLLIHIQLLIYLILSFRAINKYKQLLRENFANSKLFNQRFLFQLIFIFALGSIIVVIKNIFYFIGVDIKLYYAQVIVSLINLMFITWLIFKALQNPEIFKRVDSKLQLTGGANISLPDQQKNTSEIKIKIEKIEHFMREKEPFMDSTISLASLSESLDMETKELSYIINQELRTHFFDFINSYRINKAKELLADSSKEQLTVSEIMYDVGFNSKSSFFTCFKKSENQTPTEFRKAHHSKIN